MLVKNIVSALAFAPAVVVVAFNKEVCRCKSLLAQQNTTLAQNETLLGQLQQARQDVNSLYLALASLGFECGGEGGGVSSDGTKGVNPEDIDITTTLSPTTNSPTTTSTTTSTNAPAPTPPPTTTTTTTSTIPPPPPPPPTTTTTTTTSTTTTTTTTTFSSVLSCSDVWDFPATDNDGTYSCGARIEWLQEERDRTEQEAKLKVAQEFPFICGPCANDVAGQSSSPGPSSSPSYPPAAGKRGIARQLSSADITGLVGSTITWWNDWRLFPSIEDSMATFVSARNDIEFIPMAWNGDLTRQAVAAINGGDSAYITNSLVPSALLGFNEPNHVAQANMSPQQAADAWGDVEFLASQLNVTTLVGPSTNWSPDAPYQNPWDWYDDFFSHCTSCRVDAVSFHVYNCMRETMEFYVSEYKKMLERNGRSGLKLWLTEFACADDPQRVAGNEGAASKSWEVQCRYMQDVIPYLESETAIERYSWFSYDIDYVGESNLLNSDGTFTPLGECYNNIAVL